MSYYGSFVLECYVLRMRVMTSTVGGNLTNRPPALRHIHVNKIIFGPARNGTPVRSLVIITTEPARHLAKSSAQKWRLYSTYKLF